MTHVVEVNSSQLFRSYPLAAAAHNSSHTFEEISIEQLVIEWMDNNGEHILLLVPVLAFAESCVGIGLVVSGVLLLVVSAALYNSGVTGVELIVVLGFFGAFLGDHCGFYCGRFFGKDFHQIQFIRSRRANIVRAEEFIRRYGGAAIFIGRFIPAIRSIVPVMLGISGFRLRRYALLDALACLFWSLALGLILIGIDGVF